MAFYVQKSFAHGPIRFGVSPRRPLDKIDSDAALSTGAKGDFARKNEERFFFADSPAPIGSVQVPVEKSISSTPFWSSLKPDGTPRRWGFLALMVVGALLIFLGFGVVANKGPQGWVEVILGIAMVATPIVLTAQERKKIREQEDKARAEREERERRHREMLAAYVTGLQKLRENVNDETLRTIRSEREALDLPYEIWSAAAKQTILAIGFEALARLTPARAKEVGDLMRRSAEAAGLKPEDEAAMRQAVYRSALWHLIADDRIGDAQKGQLERLRTGLGLEDGEIEGDHAAVAQFNRLRGLTSTNLPKQQCPMPLGFREYCVLMASGQTLNVKTDKKARTETYVPAQPATLFVTNKRLILDAKSRTEVPLAKIDDVEVNGDDDVLMIRTAEAKHPIRLRVAEPFYAAAMIDLATTIDERPKGFA
ncbi:MAG: hypothetical protein ACXVJT_01530 [Thermoanaerobaculia bacterium]